MTIPVINDPRPARHRARATRAKRRLAHRLLHDLSGRQGGPLYDWFAYAAADPRFVDRLCLLQFESMQRMRRYALHWQPILGGARS